MENVRKGVQVISGFAGLHPFFFSFLIMGISAFFIYTSVKTMIPPPEIVTRHRMRMIEKELKLVLKESLDEKVDLTRLSMKSDDIYFLKDGWNFEIRYKKIDWNNHQLISYGADGKPGGQADIIYTFKLN